MMMLIASSIVMAAGAFCIGDPEFAWQLYELDHRVVEQHLDQPSDWRNRTQVTGAFLVGMGLLGTVLSMGIV